MSNLKTLKPFVKGDPRINREGKRVGTKDALTYIRSIAVDVLHEVVKTEKNKKITRLRELLLARIEHAIKGDAAAFRDVMTCYCGRQWDSVITEVKVQDYRRDYQRDYRLHPLTDAEAREIEKRLLEPDIEENDSG